MSDTRTPETDTSGRAIRQLLEEAGHIVTGSDIVSDEPADVIARVRVQLENPVTSAIITTGGTGITSRDGTFEAIDGLFEKRLTGFGELFRMLSYPGDWRRGHDEPRDGRHAWGAGPSSCCRAPRPRCVSR